MENPVRFADRTVWARNAIMQEGDDRPIQWMLLNHKERFIARMVTGILLRMIIKGSK